MWLARVSSIHAESDGQGAYAGTSLNYRVLVLNPILPAAILVVGGSLLAVERAEPKVSRPALHQRLHHAI